MITYEHAEAAAPASEAAESNKFVFHEHVIPDTARLLRLAGYSSISSNQVELETKVHTTPANFVWGWGIEYKTNGASLKWL